MANHSGNTCAVTSKNLVKHLYWFIIFFALIFASVSQSAADATELDTNNDKPDICDEGPDRKLPLLERLKILVQCARSDCKKAVYLGNFLQKYGMTDFEGRDDRYWYKVGAKCGNAWSMIEIGHPKYTTLTEVPCGDHKLEIITYCDPLKKENEFPICKKHVFSFYGKDKRLLRRRVAINKLERYEYRVIVGSAVCLFAGNNFYYFAAATNYGASCCEWFDVFDMTGKYIGTLNDRSSFRLRRKNYPTILQTNYLASTYPS